MPVSSSPLLNLVPVWASDDDRKELRQFRSIERTGYLSVTELTRDFLYDAFTENALTIVNVVITETHLSDPTTKASNPEFFRQTTTLNPSDVGNPKFLAQRIRKIVNPGAGYAVGDILTHFVPGASANVKVVVTAIDTQGVAGVTDFRVMHSGVYDNTINPIGANKRFEFRKRLNPNAAMTRYQDYSYDSNAAKPFIFQSRHTGNGWVGGQEGPTVVPKFNGPVQTNPGGFNPGIWDFWDQSFTTDGMPKGRGGSGNVDSTTSYTITATLTGVIADRTQTRWPVDGIWANIPAATNQEVFVGSELLLKPAFANSYSYIPPGTVITKVSEIDVIDGTTTRARGGGSQATDYFETTNKYIWMTTSNPVTIDKGDVFYTRGNGFVFSDNTTAGDTAEVFTVITQSRSRIDPLAADRVTVFANVAAINNTSVRLTTITHGITGYAPTIYEGAVITHEAVSPTNLSGATVVSVSNIQYSRAGATLTATANIVTDIVLPSSLTATPSTLRFTLPTDQSWRLAFVANGKQTLNVFAATSVQLRDDGNIARVTDYTGSVTDLSGVMGDVPGIAKISSLAAERATGISCSIGGAGTLSKTMTVSAIGAGKIQSGYVIDPASVTTGAGKIINNTIITSQILPLTGAEVLGGVGRYNVSQDYGTTAISFTTAIIGKVVDREVDTTDITQGFVNRSIRVANHPESYPLSYFASFTNRGLFFGVWEGTWSIMQKSRSRQLSEKDAWFSWMLVQRPVNRKNGMVRTSGQSPVFCINSVGYRYWKFIVRERDVMHPTQGDAASNAMYFDDITGTVVSKSTPYRVPADAHTDDSHGILNTTHQIALTEDSKYLVSFLYNLTTPRFRYSDELDMLGQTAGDVSMASSDITITAYGESTRRVYKALSANLPYNAGLRVCVIKDVYTA